MTEPHEILVRAALSDRLTSLENFERGVQQAAAYYE